MRPEFHESELHKIIVRGSNRAWKELTMRFWNLLLNSFRIHPQYFVFGTKHKEMTVPPAIPTCDCQFQTAWTLIRQAGERVKEGYFSIDMSYVWSP